MCDRIIPELIRGIRKLCVHNLMSVKINVKNEDKTETINTETTEANDAPEVTEEGTKAKTSPVEGHHLGTQPIRFNSQIKTRHHQK